jgi:hypothetical protein
MRNFKSAQLIPFPGQTIRHLFARTCAELNPQAPFIRKADPGAKCLQSINDTGIAGHSSLALTSGGGSC